MVLCLHFPSKHICQTRRDKLDLHSGTLSKVSGVDSTGGMSGTCGWSSKQLQLPRANFVQTSVRDTQSVAMLIPGIQWRMCGSRHFCDDHFSPSKVLNLRSRSLQACGMLYCVLWCNMVIYGVLIPMESRRDDRYIHDMTHDIS